MDTQKLTVAVAGGMLMGAGITTVSSDFTHGLILVGVGAALQLVVALLQKKGVPIAGQGPQE
jgi:hypothetical protein